MGGCRRLWEITAVGFLDLAGTFVQEMDPGRLGAHRWEWVWVGWGKGGQVT